MSFVNFFPTEKILNVLPEIDKFKSYVQALPDQIFQNAEQMKKLFQQSAILTEALSYSLKAT